MIAIQLLLIALCCSAAGAGEAVDIGPARVDPVGFLVHDVRSPYQAGTTSLRVLLPAELDPARRYPVIYVLPVEAGRESRYGDGLREIKSLGLHERHAAIFVAPTFSQLPWYADHPSDPQVRQESYLLEVVLPAVDARYPVLQTASGRLLLGFSKSGWGAWTLLLRHEDVFGRAAAWDAPLAMDQAGRYGSGPIFGSQENFERYQVTRLLEHYAAGEPAGKRLLMLGYGGFRQQHEQTHRLLESLAIPHVYRDGPQRRHDWHSGWVGDAVDLLLAD